LEQIMTTIGLAEVLARLDTSTVVVDIEQLG
jgi:hypothetical protein